MFSHTRISFEHFLLGVTLINKISVFWVALERINSSPADPSLRFYVSFYFFNILFLAVAIVFALIRRTPRFYVAGLYEIPDRLYWQLVLLLVSIAKMVSLKWFASLPEIVDWTAYGISVGLLVSILMTYQSQSWSRDEVENCTLKIRHLCKKAGLTRKELEMLKPFLIEMARKNQSVPWFWKAIVFLVTILLGALINSFANSVVDWIKAFVDFRNILPPY